MATAAVAASIVVAPAHFEKCAKKITLIIYNVLYELS